MDFQLFDISRRWQVLDVARDGFLCGRVSNKVSSGDKGRRQGTKNKKIASLHKGIPPAESSVGRHHHPSNRHHRFTDRLPAAPVRWMGWDKHGLQMGDCRLKIRFNLQSPGSPCAWHTATGLI
jgi:hypothetical protein